MCSIAGNGNTAVLAKMHIMRVVIQDKVSHNFVEGPVPSAEENNNVQTGRNEKTTFDDDLTKGTELPGDATDIDIPYYSVNERFD